MMLQHPIHPHTGEVFMADYDEGQWNLPEDAREITQFLWWVSAFTSQPVTRPPSACATTACPARLVNPSSRLIFTPWIFGKPIRPMNA
jgi:hypothetical protein